MRFQLRMCPNCNKYTLKNECLHCKITTKSAHPAKFSPDDKYLKYRTAEKY